MYHVDGKTRERLLLFVLPFSSTRVHNVPTIMTIIIIVITYVRRSRRPCARFAFTLSDGRAQGRHETTRTERRRRIRWRIQVDNAEHSRRGRRDAAATAYADPTPGDCPSPPLLPLTNALRIATSIPRQGDRTLLPPLYSLQTSATRTHATIIFLHIRAFP